MKPFHILTVLFILLFPGNSSAQERKGLVAIKVAKARDLLLNDILIYNMEKPKEWQFLVGSDWGLPSPCITLKGVNSEDNAFLLVDGQRHFTSHPLPVKKKKLPFLFGGDKSIPPPERQPMTAPDYLDMVIRKQFPESSDMKRIQLKTYNDYSLRERQQMEQKCLKEATDNHRKYVVQKGDTIDISLREVAVDRARAEYLFVSDGDTILHVMEVTLYFHTNDRTRSGAGGSQQVVDWSQQLLYTYTFPLSKRKLVESDVINIVGSLSIETPYSRAMKDPKQREIAQKEQAKLLKAIRRAKPDKGKATPFATRIENAEAANWQSRLFGMERYFKGRKTIDIPAPFSWQYWNNAEDGLIYSNDSYLFDPAEPLMDKKGNNQSYRIMQSVR
ncbi:hypothetical protein LJC35_04355 [Parabacteroides sp. OttesenSCG-928-N08]|nr:hypothetical protein [Parabacteroides sp. OttesenSCG-928-N08]